MKTTELRRRHRTPLAFVLGIASLCATSPAPAQTASESGNPQAGRTIATTFCSECHQIEPGAPGPVKADVPTFHSIANRPDIAAEAIATFVTVPHPPMPRLDLTRQQLADVVAFILSHRDADTNR